MIRSTHFQSGGFETVGSSPSIIYLKYKPIISLKKLLLQHTVYRQKKSQNLNGKTMKMKTNIPQKRNK